MKYGANSGWNSFRSNLMSSDFSYIYPTDLHSGKSVVVLRLPMYKVFQLPLELRQLTDDEFWQRVNQLDELSEQFEDTSGGFAVSISTGEKDLDIPYIRFKKTFPNRSS